MNKFFELSFDDQRRVLQQASARCGLPPQAVEKDLWVSTILQIVFDLPFADKLIFKGGTSLSKVWHLLSVSLKTLIWLSTALCLGSRAT